MLFKTIESTIGKVLDEYTHQHVSRSIILAIDVIIVATSYILSVILRYNFNLDEIPVDRYLAHFVIIVLIRSLFFLYQKSYYGIIRHTSLQDVRLLFYNITYSSICILVISLFLDQLIKTSHLYIPLSIILIDYFICLFLLIASRMFVKSIYSDIIKGRHNVYGQPILIYGAGSLGILTKNSLLNEESKYKIIGFIDDNESLVGKTVHGIEVFELEQALMRFISSTSKQPQVIVAIKNIDLNRRKQLAERFLQHNIIIKIIPPRFELFENRIDHKIITNIKIEELLQRDTIILDDVNVKQEIDHKIVLVTGAAGSIGSELVRQIVQYNPSKVYLIDHSESAVYNLEYELKQKINPLTELHFIISDVNNYLRLERLVEGIKPDVVYHCAAYKHVPLMESLPYEAIRTNIFGTKNIADLCKKFEVKKFIMISTDKAVNPTNVMGVTKRIAELYVQSLNRSPNCKTKYVITRFGNVLGSNGSVIPLFEKQILNGGPITVTHPDIERFFMTIPEACQLVLEASAMGEGGEIFIFDMGKPVKIVELARKMIQLSGLVPDQDILIKFTALRPGEKLFEELLGDNEENIKTHHPKIMIGKATSAHVKNIDLFLIELSKALVGQQELALIKLLKQFIPEYKSKNSKFENLDSDANSMSYSETV